jgi:hypothetical protein
MEGGGMHNALVRRVPRRLLRLAAVLALAVLPFEAASSQSGGTSSAQTAGLVRVAQSPGSRGGVSSYSSDVEYDGRVTFVRLRWRSDGGFRRGGWSTAWDHDYPRAEQHLSQILRELTFLEIHLDGSRVLTLDDPELTHFPIAFMWEPGFWVLSEAEATAFRAYLLKGGFAVFEDFDGPGQWANFEEQMRRVLPGAQFVKLEQPDRIFDTFFRVNDINAIVHPTSDARWR